MRETTRGPVPLIELAADAEIMAKVTGMDFTSSDYNRLKALHQDGSLEEISQENMEIGMRYVDLCLNFSRRIGYDYVTSTVIVP